MRRWFWLKFLPLCEIKNGSSKRKEGKKVVRGAAVCSFLDVEWGGIGGGFGVFFVVFRQLFLMNS